MIAVLQLSNLFLILSSLDLSSKMFSNLRMLFNTYRNKNVIEELLEPPIEWSDCLEVVNYLFDTSLDFKYCFAVQDKGEKTVGLSFNFSGDNKSIMANLKGILRVVFKFEEVVEARIWFVRISFSSLSNAT